MQRRRFLSSLAGATSLAAAGTRTLFAQTPRVDKVIVIGAGIVGASIAHALAKRGCEVVIVDRGLPASQASGNTFAWINAAYTNQPASYLKLRRQALVEYKKLAAEVAFPIRWSGSLEWFQDASNERTLIESVTAFQQLGGASTSMISADEASALEPNLAVSGAWRFAHSTDDGAIDAPAATQALFDAALKNGAEPKLFAEVRTLRARRNRVRVGTALGHVDADMVVVAAGIGSTRLAALIDEPVDTETAATPGIIVTTEALPMMLNTVLYPPRVHIHQLPDGRVVIGEKAGPTPLDVHRDALAKRPNAFPDADQAERHARRLLNLARAYLPQLADARHIDVGIGWRPMPRDGLPVIGHSSKVPQVYFASMHSGVTLAPIVAKYAAQEILDGVRVAALDDFRPQRF